MYIHTYSLRVLIQCTDSHVFEMWFTTATYVRPHWLIQLPLYCTSTLAYTAPLILYVHTGLYSSPYTVCPHWLIQLPLYCTSTLAYTAPLILYVHTGLYSSPYTVRPHWLIQLPLYCTSTLAYTAPLILYITYVMG